MRPSVARRAASHAQTHAQTHGYAGEGVRAARFPAAGRLMWRFSTWIFNLQVPSGVGMAASGLFLLATLAYGVVLGERTAAILGGLKDARDAAANAAGFRIASIALSGERHVSREEILGTAGVTGTTSLLFFDVEAARDRLKANPWIADATVLKLYPDRLQIGIKEREAFALWQQAGRVSVVAGDGTVLEPYVNPGLSRLPLVVGLGAAARAKDFLALLDSYPDLRDQVRASVLIGERRWNLRLKNGLDIRLPESGVASALVTLVALDKDKKLLSRDIVAVDLRLPDRVTVQLSDGAAAQRAEALKNQKPAKKGGAA
jgi:cell division protein FtsQ